MPETEPSHSALKMAAFAGTD